MKVILLNLQSSMKTALWVFIVGLMLGSATGVFPPAVGAFAMPFAVLLALIMLSIARRKKLAAGLKPGEKITMPKADKAVVLVLLILIVGLILVGRLTRQ